MDTKNADIYSSKFLRVRAFKWTGDIAEMPQWAQDELGGCGAISVLAGKLFLRDIATPAAEGEPYKGSSVVQVPVGNYVVQRDPYTYRHYAPEAFEELFIQAKEAEPEAAPRPQKRLCMKNYQSGWTLMEVPTQESMDFLVNVQIEVYQGKSSPNLDELPQELQGRISDAARGAIYEVMRRVMS